MYTVTAQAGVVLTHNDRSEHYFARVCVRVRVCVCVCVCMCNRLRLGTHNYFRFCDNLVLVCVCLSVFVIAYDLWKNVCVCIMRRREMPKVRRRGSYVCSA